MQNFGFGRMLSMFGMNAEIRSVTTSCRNRHCFQNAKDKNWEDWITNRETELLPYLIFTWFLRFLKYWTNSIASANHVVERDILFESVWETLLQTFKSTKSPNGNDCCFVNLGTEFESSSCICTALFRKWRGWKRRLENIKNGNFVSPQSWVQKFCELNFVRNWKSYFKG